MYKMLWIMYKNLINYVLCVMHYVPKLLHYVTNVRHQIPSVIHYVQNVMPYVPNIFQTGFSPHLSKAVSGSVTFWSGVWDFSFALDSPCHLCNN